MNHLGNENSNNSIIDIYISEMISQVENENTKKYINNRIMPQVKWYSSKSTQNKHRYYFWMTISLILGIMVSVISVFANGSIWTKMIIAILGAAVTATNAYISLHNFKDLWIVYRKTHGVLTRTLYHYFNNAGIYSQYSTQNQKDVLLVNICEEEISKESDGWYTILQK
ncbi:hypothetical protein C806_01455 [Lachnospiraceae bacterium 3-1]|nr:hypothetical protein C806_01455 [Lachnospiraceae bacterium 3-1]